MACCGFVNVLVVFLAILGGLVCFETALPAFALKPVRVARSVLPFAVSQATGLRLDALDPKLSIWRQVRETVPQGDADGVLRKIDDIGWSGYWHMSVGDRKGALVMEALRLKLEAGLKDEGVEGLLVVELGTFLGYGATTIAREIQNFRESQGVSHTDFPVEFITIDPDPAANAVAAAMLHHAGFAGDRVPECEGGKAMALDVRCDFSDNVFRQLAKDGRKIDFLFVDHVKQLYLRDLKLALELDLFAPRAVLVGDNVKLPGAPDFRAFLVDGEGSEVFETVIHPAMLEYSTKWEDEVTVSHYRAK